MLNINLEAANALGLRVWRPRAVRCLVVQHCAHGIKHVLLPQEKKILTGMLGVLEIPAADLQQAIMYGNNPAVLLTQMQGLITRWHPEFLLLLDANLPDLQLRNVVQTFSPGYLMRNPQYKSQAYKSLLTLRAMLHGTS